MKQLSTVMLCLTFTLLVSAQTKSVELFDIMKSLAPDSTESTPLPSWTHASQPANPIQFTAKPEMNKVTKKFLLNKDANVSISGKTFSCGGNANGCNWAISLEGNNSGYSQISISPDLSQEVSYQTSIEYLFGKNKYKAKLLKKCDDTSDMASYEIKIPGKKPFWIQSSMSGGTEGAAIYINCYFDRKELNIECL